MPREPSELARRLAREAEAVCRHYLSNGKRQGRYWLVGDVHNTPGRSLFVRLQESPKGPPGKWTDAATGEHGDLLDIIRESLGLRDFREAAQEAERFLKLPRIEPELVSKADRPAVPAEPGGAFEPCGRCGGPCLPCAAGCAWRRTAGRGRATVAGTRARPRVIFRTDAVAAIAG